LLGLCRKSVGGFAGIRVKSYASVFRIWASEKDA
jgi:hypothetical protein